MIQVYGNRTRLVDVHKLRNARWGYRFHNINGKRRVRQGPEAGVERDIFIDRREQLRRHKVIKPQVDAFFGAIALCVVIYYVSNTEITGDYIPGMFIIIIVGIRYVIVFGRELSVNVSQILDLRKGSKVMQMIMENDDA
jgi:hypothetical protein